MNKTFEMNGFSPDYLALAHRLLPGKGCDNRPPLHDACTTRAYFYHIRGHPPIHKLPALVAGDDYRDFLLRRPGPLARRLLAHPQAAALSRATTNYPRRGIILIPPASPTTPESETSPSWSLRIFTGTIGWFGFDGCSQQNIAIRTPCKRPPNHLQVGSGIVSDSVPQHEYEETLHKAAGILEAAQ